MVRHVATLPKTTPGNENPTALAEENVDHSVAAPSDKPDDETLASASRQDEAPDNPAETTGDPKPSAEAEDPRDETDDRAESEQTRHLLLRLPILGRLFG